jgi:hypothetical protein
VKHLSNRSARGRLNTKKRRKTVKNIFIRGFLQSFFIVAILLTAGILGYQTTMKLWMIEPEQKVETEKPEPTAAPITIPSIDEVSRNLIFCYDYDNKTINKLVLEIFHCEKKELTYITIPMSTQFTMTDTLYKKLIAVEPSIPQIIRLSAVRRYLEESVVFDYGVLLIEDMLKLGISYYTVLPIELYQTIFDERSMKTGENAAWLLSGESIVVKDHESGISETAEAGLSDGTKTGLQEEAGGRESDQVVAEVFRKDYLKVLDRIESIEELRAYIEELYQDIKSNLSLFEKMNYLESYARTSLKNVSFTRIAGRDSNSGFVMDEEQTARLLHELGV